MMIIECINCSKKFEVNSDFIPEEGRTIQCGACNHVWFYDLKNQSSINPSDEKAEIKNESKGKLEPEFSATEDDLDEDFNQETEEELLDIPTFLRRQAN